MTSMPRLTKYLGAQASSSRLPEAKPWYACMAIQCSTHRAGSSLLTAKVNENVHLTQVAYLVFCIGGSLAAGCTQLGRGKLLLPGIDATEAYHIEEGKVVLLDAEVRYLLPLLPGGVDACGIVRTSCTSQPNWQC